MGYFLKALRIMSFVADWSAKALEDGVVTGKELLALGEGICGILNVSAAFEIPMDKGKV